MTEQSPSLPTTPPAESAHTPRPRLAWAIALTTLVAGPLALSTTFATSRSGALAPAPTAAAFVLTSLLLAAIWSLGGLGVIRAAGPDQAVRMTGRGRAARLALAIGVVFAAACLSGGLVLRALPLTRPWVADALDTAHAAPGAVVLAVALVAGAGEEVFFRLALTRITSTRMRWVLPVALYAAATVATGNLALVLVAVPLALVATLVWVRTGRWTSPLIVHAVWSLTMVGIFPHLAA